MKASPLLRAWRKRLEDQGVVIHVRHSWSGWDAGGALVFDTPDGAVTHRAAATLLALGGASWPRLGSDGGWAAILARKGVATVPFRASNCGVEVTLSDVTRHRFAGAPLKTIALSLGGERVAGEAVLARYGLEGGAVYALSAPIRRPWRRADRQGWSSTSSPMTARPCSPGGLPGAGPASRSPTGCARRGFRPRPSPCCATPCPTCHASRRRSPRRSRPCRSRSPASAGWSGRSPRREV